MIKSCSLGLLCVAAFLVTLSLGAQQTPPSGDTYVSETNYGGGNNLIVASGATSYVQFNLCEFLQVQHQDHTAALRQRSDEERCLRRLPAQ
jgi:hypothetical protein